MSREAKYSPVPSPVTALPIRASWLERCEHVGPGLCPTSSPRQQWGFILVTQGCSLPTQAGMQAAWCRVRLNVLAHPPLSPSEGGPQGDRCRLRPAASRSSVVLGLSEARCLPSGISPRSISQPHPHPRHGCAASPARSSFSPSAEGSTSWPCSWCFKNSFFFN